jgi:hypothetical protein
MFQKKLPGLTLFHLGPLQITSAKLTKSRVFAFELFQKLFRNRFKTFFVWGLGM